MARKNRLAPPQIIINGQHILVSPKWWCGELTAEAIKDLLATDTVSSDSKWEGEARPMDRIWQAYQERGGSEGRWMRTTTTQKHRNGITIHTSGDWYWGVEPNPFRNISEPTLRAALRAKGYIP